MQLRRSKNNVKEETSSEKLYVIFPIKSNYWTRPENVGNILDEMSYMLTETLGFVYRPSFPWMSNRFDVLFNADS